MLWFPVKKIRKQFKLLLLLVLLTFAVWFTYLHINLVRQGKALRLHFAYGRGKQVGGSPGSPPPTFDAFAFFRPGAVPHLACLQFPQLSNPRAILCFPSQRLF